MKFEDPFHHPQARPPGNAPAFAVEIRLAVVVTIRSAAALLPLTLLIGLPAPTPLGFASPAGTTTTTAATAAMLIFLGIGRSDRCGRSGGGFARPRISLIVRIVEAAFVLKYNVVRSTVT
jgi:hypothetical protein